MKCTVGIKMTADGVRVKCNKDDVVKFRQNKLYASV
jgi:hypothetical protein